MPEHAKIALSVGELDNLLDAEWILTKHRVIGKIQALLGYVAQRQKAIVHAHSAYFNDQVLQAAPKITKGENYLQLPYLILDYPAFFSKEDIFAIRTMCWWGNFFSVTLMLKGQYLERYQANVISRLKEDADNFFICINDDEWAHHFEETNYVSAANILSDPSVLPKGFLKIAMRFNLAQWDQMPVLLEGAFERLIQMLA